MTNVYDVIIIGSGPAGLTAAMYAGRAKIRTLVIEAEENGGQIRITEEVANYPGIAMTSGKELTTTMRTQAESFGATFATDKIVAFNFDGDIKEMTGESGEVYRSLSVIIAAGAKRRTLGFDGEAKFTGRGVAFCATCDGEFFTDKDVFVIGAGYAAAEEAMYLTRFAKQVTIIAREPDFTCSKMIADKVKTHPKVKIHFNTEVVKIDGETLLNTAKFINNQTGETWDYTTDPAERFFGMFVFAGYEPASELFRGKINTDAIGYITTNDDMQTNIAGIYAAGDIRPKRLRQLVTAVSDGATAATAAEIYVTANRKHILPDFEEESTTSVVRGSFFDTEVVRQIKYVMEHCTNKITIRVSLDGSPLSDEVKGFLATFVEIAGENKVALVIEEGAKDGILPAITFDNPNGEHIPIYYHGVPGGHELESFVLAIYNVSGTGQKLTDEQKERIAALPAMNLKIGISLSCTMCPATVQAAQRISAANPKVTTHIIDMRHYPDIQEQHTIMSLPAVIINDGDNIIFGKKEIDSLLNILEKQ
ncbi:MAG: FAD-dependent oxidoreductase [Defluviitaleaceae bacterium]|nr:FAD-dependent oxidoreductase [Defluviitaleaceae bacterium]